MLIITEIIKVRSRNESSGDMVLTFTNAQENGIDIDSNHFPIFVKG